MSVALSACPLLPHFVASNGKRHYLFIYVTAAAPERMCMSPATGGPGYESQRIATACVWREK